MNDVIIDSHKSTYSYNYLKSLIAANVFALILAPVNLAYDKPARQSHTPNVATDAASNAVNGKYNDNDYSNTGSSGGSKWWMVDLQSKYSIGRVELSFREERRKCNLLFAGYY